MAILQKIRNQSVLLLVVVGVAMFAFIIGDFLNSGATYFNKSRENIGKVNGEAIHILDYTAAVDQMTEVYKIETGTQTLTEELSSQIRNSVWETLVNEKLLEAEAKRLGITVTKDELAERLMGGNIHPIIQQRRVFFDENGQFSPAILMNFLAAINSDDEEMANSEQIKQLKQYWLFWENAVRTSILQEKYVALMANSLTANTLEAEDNFAGRSKNAQVSYVMQPYYALSDSAFQVTDAEVKALYQKRKEQFKQEPNRNILYVTYPIVPSEEDYNEVKAWIENLQEEFATTTDVVGVVNSNSDVMYDGRYYSENTVPAALKEFAFTGKENDVTPVMFDQTKYYMARIMESGVQLPDSVNLRHIYMLGDDQARVDSIVSAIKAGADFATLASTYSVAQTAQMGGELGWLQQNSLPENMSKQAFTEAVNAVFTVKDAQGVQIFQVLERSALTPKVKLAILERTVVPSSRTQSAIYNEAKQFVVENDNAEKFQAAAKDKGLSVQSGFALLENTETVGTLAQSRPIVRWAFEAKEGKVSDVFECEDNFVVATLVKVNDTKYKSVDEVAFDLQMELKNDKKAAQLIASLEGKSLEEAAQALQSEAQQAENVNMAAYRFGNVGVEPYVIGAASQLAAGSTSHPLKGNAGVFVVKADSVNVTATNYDETSEIMQLNMRRAYSLSYMTIEMLQEGAEIEDNRANFY